MSEGWLHVLVVPRPRPTKVCTYKKTERVPDVATGKTEWGEVSGEDRLKKWRETGPPRNGKARLGKDTGVTR